jgi:hypothetical protein
MKDEGFKQGSLFKAFILHPSSFILFFSPHLKANIDGVVAM